MTSTTYQPTRRYPVPITVDHEAIAKGLINMMDDNQRTVLRFGMLPAPLMRVLEGTLEAKFRDDFDLDEDLPLDRPLSWVTPEGDFIEFTLKKLIADVAHNVSLAMYHHGDLVV